MKTFKDLKALEKRLKNGICWGDWIKIKGRVYRMEEYGSAENNDYMRFYNANSKHTIFIDYFCPSYSKGYEIRAYKFIRLYDCQD